MDRPFNVLFLSTRDSARSIMAEAILNKEGKGRLKAYSAGCRPADAVYPYAAEFLTALGYETSAARPKTWDEFATPDAPEMDFIFTVCDDAAAETCPVWPGHPASSHWGVPDPVAVTGKDAERYFAFTNAYRMLLTRILNFINLPIDGLDHQSLHHHLHAIGRDEHQADQSV